MTLGEYTRIAKENHCLAVRSKLGEKQLNKLGKVASKRATENLDATIVKGRFKGGHLLVTVNGDSKNRIWLDLYGQPNAVHIIEHVLNDPTIRIVGSVGKLIKMMFS